MAEINARNVNQALSTAIWKLRCGNYPVEQTRNGPVLAFPEPVITTYRHPDARVLFAPERDANPIFHLLESIWMLAGRRDVAFLQQFNSTIGKYSDDDSVFNAAYGYRWRSHFGVDQLKRVVEMLRRDPGTRQAVIQMWDPADLSKDTKDKACNTQIVFDCRGDKLNMSVFNRSNDLWYGAYGANAVHMSFLQEFVAHAVKLPIGPYRQISNNLHLYMEVYDGQKVLDNVYQLDDHDYYADGQVRPLPILENADYAGFLYDCESFCCDPFNAEARYYHPFFLGVAQPMAMVSRMRKSGAGDGSAWAAKIKAPDWRRATFDWIHRRELKKQQSASAS